MRFTIDCDETGLFTLSAHAPNGRVLSTVRSRRGPVTDLYATAERVYHQTSLRRTFAEPQPRARLLRHLDITDPFDSQ